MAITLDGTDGVTTPELTADGVKIGLWEIKLDVNDLRFVYNGTDVAKITTTGEIIALDDISAFGAP